MAPEALSLLREISPPVDAYVRKEAKRQNFVAKGAEMFFNPDSVQVIRDPEGFAASSLIFQDSNKAHLVSSCLTVDNSTKSATDSLIFAFLVAYGSLISS